MAQSIVVRHYWWAGLDFMFDRRGEPVFLEANRASHMLGEYQELVGNDRPFALTAAAMNAAGGTPCLLWRAGDPFPDADEDACFIAARLMPHLREPPVICNVEANEDPRTELIDRDGRPVRPGSIFRWWYGLPWSYERAGVRVINPNCAWVAVRDKWRCSQAVQAAATFRTPRGFAVESAAEVSRILQEHADLFAEGYVVKPRIGWGGHGVQVAAKDEPPHRFSGKHLLQERIVPPLRTGRFWVVRAFVMAGEYLGGVCHTSTEPVTNYWQGGRAEPLPKEWSDALEPAALEAVALLDAAAAAIHELPVPESELTLVNYTGRGMN